MNVAICIVCRDTLEWGQSSNPSAGGDEGADFDQRLSEYEGEICTISCGHVLHVQCVYLWWKTITEQVRCQENVFGVGIGNHGTATGSSENPAPGRYSCPLCGALEKKPAVFELFLTFDSGSRSGNRNDSGDQTQELKRQMEELKAKNEELSNHYAELCRQERGAGLSK